MNFIKRILIAVFYRIVKVKIFFTTKNLNDSVCSIAVLYYIPNSSLKYNNWNDGFTKAIDLLQGLYKIHLLNLSDSKPNASDLNKFDLVLVKSNWGWIPDQYIRTIKGLKVKKALAISGVNNPGFKDMLFYDLLFYETFWYKKQLSSHPLAIHAFGIDTSIMKEDIAVEKDYDALSVGGLKKYKGHEDLININGKKAIIGDFNDGEADLRNTLDKAGVELIDFVNYNDLNRYYNRCKSVHINADLYGGGERAVLEARACNVPVVISKQNEKLKGLNKGPIWNHFYYASQLDLGIKKLFNSSAEKKQIRSNKNVNVGLNSFHNGKFQIKGNGIVYIGNYCAIGEDVKLITVNHDYNYLSIQGGLYKKAFGTDHPGEIDNMATIARTKGPIVIGSDVWIGDNVIILSGVKIGDGCCIAAGSIVTKDLPAFSICAGVPCKYLKDRFEKEKIEKILSDPWWDWSFEKIRQNKNLFFESI